MSSSVIASSSNEVCKLHDLQNNEVSKPHVSYQKLCRPVNGGLEKSYFQVAYLMPTQDVRDREFGAFADVGDNFPRYVLSMDPVDMGVNGIRHRNICDFLMSSEDRTY